MRTVRPAALLALALAPLSAVAGERIVETRVATVDGETALRVTTRSDDGAAARVTANVENADGSTTSLSCGLAGVAATGTGAVSIAPKAESRVTLSLLGADGKPLGSYEGVISAAGQIVFEKGNGPVDAALVSGFVYGPAGALSAVVSVEGGVGAALSGTLGFTESKVALSFGPEASEWSCALPENDGSLWNFHVWTEVAFSPGRSGKTIWKRDDASKVRLAAPWENGIEGVSALSLDPYGLTSLAVLPPAADGCGWGSSCKSPGSYALVAASGGWALDEQLPSALSLALEGGGTVDLPLNSAQRTGSVALSFEKDPSGQDITLITDAGKLTLRVGDRGVCQLGKCYAIPGFAGGSADLIVTAYGGDASALPDEVKVAFAPAGGKEPGAAPKEPFAVVALDAEIGLVFGRAVGFGPGALGGVISAKPSLIGLEQDGIHSSTYNSRAVVSASPVDSALVLGALSFTGPAPEDDGLLAAGDPIGLSRVGVGGVTEPVGPPVVWAANGAGTRSAIPSTRNKPGLR